MCAQTRPRFILSSERVFWGIEFEPMLTPREKSPLPENEEDRTRDAVDSELNGNHQRNQQNKKTAQVLCWCVVVAFH